MSGSTFSSILRVDRLAASLIAIGARVGRSARGRSAEEGD
jgi:hypothetical protein